MIGNDIIDINLAKAFPKSGNSRFLNKVFTKQEQDLIGSREEPELQLWTLWSMKETAYKAHQRMFNLPRKLNPLSFNCIIEPSHQNGRVKVDDFSYDINIEISPDYIHCTTRSRQLFQKIYRSTPTIKDSFLKDVESKFPDTFKKLILTKNKYGVPSLIVEISLKKVPVSLSHHGDFTAFVIPLINS